MADESQSLRGINWREAFPFTHLFRAFRIAVHPSKLILGLIALLALYMGGRILDHLWTPRSLAVPSEVYEYEHTVTSGGTSEQFDADRLRLRDAIESSYADRLIALEIVKDSDPVKQKKIALAAAESGEHLGEVKAKILKKRADNVAPGRQRFPRRQARRGKDQRPER